MLYTYLSNKSIKDLPGKNLKNIVLGNSREEALKFLNSLIDKNRGNVLLIELPIHKQIFNDWYKDFFWFI